MNVKHANGQASANILIDRFGRKLDSLRISITQRCNLQCFFCHAEGEKTLGNEMTREEIVEISRIACKLGMKKVKITGGEPLLRTDLLGIVSGIAEHADEVSMTTNGVLLHKYAKKLYESGLKRVNVSLPALNPENFEAITRKNNSHQVKDGIKAAVQNDLYPVKINMVILKGINVHEIPEAIDFTQAVGATLQLIEFQPIQPENYVYWKKFHYDPTPIENWLKRKAFSIQENPLHKRRRYILEKNSEQASIEVVRPMHNSEFCQNCTRLRVTSDGRLKTCLLRNDNLVDIVSLVRKNASQNELKGAFKRAAMAREPYWRKEKEDSIKVFT